MIEKNPLVSVIIPCYNAEKYVESSIRSIMSQTYRNLEIIITDDCSTDGTFEILQKLVKEDSRIKLYKNEINLKIVKTLNNMIEVSLGKYIARMDADDISLPERIENQVAFLEQNTDISFLGTNAFLIDEKNFVIGKSHLPLSPNDINIYIKYANPFFHPTIMLRSDIIKKMRYNEEFFSAEDYELWKRISSVCKASNLKDCLLKYRILKTSVSNSLVTKNRQEFLLNILSQPIDNEVHKLSDKRVIANLLITKSRTKLAEVSIFYKFIYYSERFFYRIKNAFIKF